MKKIINGIVAKKSGDKTIKVKTCFKMKHKKYLRIISVYRCFLVHDENNSCVVGDKVSCIESRPISKNKHFVLLKKEM